MQLVRRKFTVNQYHRMVNAGVLTEDDRVELLQGEIVEMSPVGRRHAACVKRLNELFADRLNKQVLIGVQDPIHLADDSEPQPDLVLLRRRADFYESNHPQPEDIFLLVEVADTTIETDRAVKLPLYAEAGIAEVWLVDLHHSTIAVYREPTPQGYQNCQIFSRGQALMLLAFPDASFSVNAVLG